MVTPNDNHFNTMLNIVIPIVVCPCSSFVVSSGKKEGKLKEHKTRWRQDMGILHFNLYIV